MSLVIFKYTKIAEKKFTSLLRRQSNLFFTFI